MRKTTIFYFLEKRLDNFNYIFFGWAISLLEVSALGSFVLLFEIFPDVCLTKHLTQKTLRLVGNAQLHCWRPPHQSGIN